MVLCVASSNCHFKDLERRFANYPRIQFMSSPLDVLVREKKMECFDIVLIDDYTPSERETFEPLTAIPEGKPTIKPSTEDAAHFMVRMVHQFPHQVTIVGGGCGFV